MLHFDHVTKRYARSAEPALRDLCMEIKPGVLYGLLGPNGAGKTTAIRLLTGVLAPTEGRVLVGGYDMAADPVAAKRLIHPEFRITREHGTWVKKGGVWMSAIYHPSALLRDLSKRPETFDDLISLRDKIRETGANV